MNAPTPSNTPAPRQILIVDDSRTIRASLRIALQGLGFKVLEAENGYVAIQVVAQNRPELIFADVMMPRLDGYKFCTVVKSNPEFAGIPVVMLTSKDGMIDQARAQLARSDGFMIKPFTQPALLGALHTHMNWTPSLGTGAVKPA